MLRTWNGSGWSREGSLAGHDARPIRALVAPQEVPVGEGRANLQRVHGVHISCLARGCPVMVALPYLAAVPCLTVKAR